MVNKSPPSEIPNGYMEESILRQLAVELARDIQSPTVILKTLGLTEDDYNAIKDTRSFQTMYYTALAEWNTAGNTQKRAKLKAAAMVEETLPFFYADLEARQESLTSRVGLLQTLARIGGLGQADAVVSGPSGGAGAHQFFKLEIHLQGKQEPIVIEGSSEPHAPDYDQGLTTDSYEATNETPSETLKESPLARGEPFDQF